MLKELIANPGPDRDWPPLESFGSRWHLRIVRTGSRANCGSVLFSGFEGALVGRKHTGAGFGPGWYVAVSLLSDSNVWRDGAETILCQRRAAKFLLCGGGCCVAWRQS